MSTRSNRAPTERQREWLERLRNCRAQGLSLKAYAEQAGLDVQRFYHWHRRLKRLGLIGGGKVVSFAPVQIQGPRTDNGRQRLHFPNGLVLEWDGNADLVLVERLLGLSRGLR